jgi:hypothetical protein
LAALPALVVQALSVKTVLTSCQQMAEKQDPLPVAAAPAARELQKLHLFQMAHLAALSKKSRFLAAPFTPQVLEARRVICPHLELLIPF